MVSQFSISENNSKLVSQGSMNISAAISMAMDVPHGSELYWLNNSVHNAQMPPKNQLLVKLLQCVGVCKERNDLHCIASSCQPSWNGRDSPNHSVPTFRLLSRMILAMSQNFNPQRADTTQ